MCGPAGGVARCWLLGLALQAGLGQEECAAEGGSPPCGLLDTGGLGPGRPPRRVERWPRADRGSPFFVGEPLLMPGRAGRWPAAQWTLEGLAERLRGERVQTISFGCGIEKDEEDEERGEAADAASAEDKAEEEEDDGRSLGCDEEERDAGDFFSSLSNMSVGSANQSGSGHRAGLQVLMLREEPDLFVRRPDLWDDLRPTHLVPFVDFTRRGYGFEARLWAGPGGATTGVHADLDPGAFLVHVGPGRKRFIALPPTAAQHLGAETVPGDGGQYPPREMNLFAKDLAGKFPSTAALRGHPDLVRVTLQPGDVLFLPCGWFHQVQYVNEASVSITLIAAHKDLPQSSMLSLEGCKKHTRNP